MRRLSAQMQLYIAIAVVVIAAVLVVVLGIMPEFQKASELDTKIAAAQGELTTAQALVARRQSSKAQSAANEVELMRIANEVPDSPQLPGTIIELQDTANASGVTLSQLQVSDVAAPAAAAGAPAAVAPSYNVLPINATVSGQWADLIDFYRRLGKLERGVRVKQTSVAYVIGTETVPEHVQASVSIEVYMMSGATTFAPVGAPAATTKP